MSLPHKTIPVQVWADIDVGVVEMVRYLNTIPGVRTLASCQGTIGEGGPNPYRAQVMATWPEDLFERLVGEFDITPLGENWGYLHPKDAARQSAKPEAQAVVKLCTECGVRAPVKDDTICRECLKAIDAEAQMPGGF